LRNIPYIVYAVRSAITATAELIVKIYNGGTTQKLDLNTNAIDHSTVQYQHLTTLLYDFIGDVVDIVAGLRKLLSVCRSVVNPVEVPRKITEIHTRHTCYNYRPTLTFRQLRFIAVTYSATKKLSV